MLSTLSHQCGSSAPACSWPCPSCPCPPATTASEGIVRPTSTTVTPSKAARRRSRYGSRFLPLASTSADSCMRLRSAGRGSKRCGFPPSPTTSNTSTRPPPTCRAKSPSNGCNTATRSGPAPASATPNDHVSQPNFHPLTPREIPQPGDNRKTMAFSRGLGHRTGPLDPAPAGRAWHRGPQPWISLGRPAMGDRNPLETAIPANPPRECFRSRFVPCSTTRPFDNC